jgi:hypothetical protein
MLTTGSKQAAARLHPRVSIVWGQDHGTGTLEFGERAEGTEKRWRAHGLRFQGGEAEALVKRRVQQRHSILVEPNHISVGDEGGKNKAWANLGAGSRSDAVLRGCI